jgi:hypothetical protein
LHETGHALAARLTNTDLQWGVGTYNQPLGFTEHAKNNSSGMLVHGAGLATQLICSEIILDSDSVNKNDSLVRGMMYWNVANPIIYSLDYWFIHRSNEETNGHYRGDLQGLEHYSDERTANGYAVLMTGLAIFQGYRFLKMQNWAPRWIKSTAVDLDFQPAGSDGAALTLQIKF